MRPANPLSLKFAQPKDLVIFAASQLPGTRKTQEDFFINFNDECFAVTDGVGGMPHGDIAAKLAAETAIWGYKLIRQRRFYWLDKKLLMRRIFRSTNIAVWQKQRESGFEKGMATTLEVLVVGDRNFWLGHVGDSSAWILQQGVCKKLTVDDVDEKGQLTKVVGRDRYGLVPQFASGKFSPNDTLLLATDGLTRYVDAEKIKQCMAGVGTTAEGLSRAVILLLESAKSAGSTDNMTVCIVKRIRAT